jgi:glycosyltransferase involved in cell wall biosynthesis
MRILHIIPNLKKGGAERLALNSVSAIQSLQNTEVQLITFRSENDYKFLTNSLDWKVIPSRVIPSLSGKSKVDVKQLQAYIDAFQPDVIHSHLFETEMVLAHISLPLKTKRIVHFHDNMHQFRNLSFKTIFNKTYLTDFFEKRIVSKKYPKKTTAIAISKNTGVYCKRNLSKNISVVLLHNAIDLAVFEKKERASSSNEITLIGSLVENKGHLLAIYTIKELKNRGIDVKLNCLGDGIEREKLEKLVNELELEKEIVFHGNIDSPETFLQHSFCYFLTSKSEAFGLTIIEAMACGLPVVCTDGKGNRDLIHEGENGFMVWERDSILLADKIELLLKNETLRKAMGEKARKFAQGFGMEKYVSELLSVYKS